MCIGIPGRIVSVEGFRGMADIGGVSREINLMLLEDVEVGEHVLIHAGYAIGKVDEAEAERILVYLDELTASQGGQ